MLDISFWLRFPLLLRHSDFVTAALEECKAAIRNTEVRLSQWKQRFETLSRDPATVMEDLNLCAQEFTALSGWIEKETLRVLSRTISFSYSIVKSTWKRISEIEDVDRLVGLYQILRIAVEKCRTDQQKVTGDTKHAIHRFNTLVEKTLKEVKKQIETLFPGELAKLEAAGSEQQKTLAGARVQV